MPKLLYDRRILIVEDTRVGYDWVTLLRAVGGAVPDVVTNVARARQRVRLDEPAVGSLPDIVLIDYQLTGGMSGSALADAMRQAPHLQKVLRVSISGRSRTEVIAGFAAPDTLYHGYLSKLMTPPELVGQLATLFQSSVPA